MLTAPSGRRLLTSARLSIDYRKSSETLPACRETCKWCSHGCSHAGDDGRAAARPRTSPGSHASRDRTAAPNRAPPDAAAPRQRRAGTRPTRSWPRPAGCSASSGSRARRCRHRREVGLKPVVALLLLPPQGGGASAALVARANVVPLDADRRRSPPTAARRRSQLYRFVRGDVEALCALPFDINEIHRIASRDPRLRTATGGSEASSRAPAGRRDPGRLDDGELRDRSMPTLTALTDHGQRRGRAELVPAGRQAPRDSPRRSASAVADLTRRRGCWPTPARSRRRRRSTASTARRR